MFTVALTSALCVCMCVWKRECEREKESMLYLFSRGPQLLLCYAAVHASTAYQQCRHHHQQSLSQAHILNWTRGKAAAVFRVCVCVCVRERVCGCGCVRERKEERERVCVYGWWLLPSCLSIESWKIFGGRERGEFLCDSPSTPIWSKIVWWGDLCARHKSFRRVPSSEIGDDD